MFFSSRKKAEPVAPFDRAAGISLSSVSKSFEADGTNVHVLKDVSLSLQKPRTAILGLNGSGKSTLLKMLNGLEEPEAGEVSVGGLPVKGNLSTIRRKVGFLFSNPAAQLVMPTALEDVELSLRTQNLGSLERAEKAKTILEAVGMGHRANHSVYDLSGGERQLVALATLLAVEPEVLLLDEPTTLLDLRNQMRLVNILKTLPQQLVISTHDLGLAASCDEVLVMHQGQMLIQDVPERVIPQYQSWCSDGFPGEEC